jgi:hypothetical protein
MTGPTPLIRGSWQIRRDSRILEMFPWLAFVPK